MKPIIKVENLSKQYRLGNIGTGTLSNDLKRWWHGIRGKEDPFLKIGETNDRSTKGESEYVWALKDINFEVMPGEILGIIGKNGAGKSTLLKILSKVTGPTTGRIDYNGRIGSLLEVGTGFHPELTGRENIFLNGAILGMTKSEIRSKLDEIVDFSGCERYIDTPVKRYSSGMTVRLGFAVAAHLEPEILVVDEVLAVGDAEFQKKAIGKMQDVSRNEGRTVLFVSHNMGSIQQLCHKSIVLENGKIGFEGKLEEAVNIYLGISQNRSDIDILDLINIKNPYIRIDEIFVNGSPKQKQFISGRNSKLIVNIKGQLKISSKLCLEALIMNEHGIPIAIYNPDFTFDTVKTYTSKKFDINKTIILPERINRGKLIVNIYLTDPLKGFFVHIPNALILECEGFANSSGYIYSIKDGGVQLLI